MFLQAINQVTFLAHGYCLLWKPWLVALHAGSDLLIAAAYFAIPVAILIFIRRRPKLQMKGLAGMFSTFILLCGLTHVVALITLWYPIYEIQGFVKAATAAVSVATAFVIFPLIPKAVAIPEPEELRIANARLTEEIAAHKRTLAELQAARDALEKTVERRTEELHRTETLFKAAQESSPDGFMLFTSVRDENGDIADFEWRYANNAAGTIIGRDPDALVGKRLLVEMPGNKSDGLFDLYAKVVETGEPWQAEFHYDHDGIKSWFRSTAVKAEDGFAVAFSDISTRKQNEQQLILLMQEVNHRSKNLLSVIQAIVRLTARDTDPADFAKSLADRLQGLAASQDLIVNGNWTTVSLENLIRSQLNFLGDSLDDRVRLSGPEVSLKPEAAQGIGLALHELATNAMKHGALSSETGSVAIEWQTAPRNGATEFTIAWSEAGGPPVVRPARQGFGSTVIEKMVARSLNGQVRVDYDPAGFRWVMTTATENLSLQSRSASSEY